MQKKKKAKKEEQNLTITLLNIFLFDMNFDQ